jgi:adenylate cyclase
VKSIDELLLGGEIRYSRADVIAKAGVGEEFTERLWRALGFAEVPDGQVAFTDGDVAALARIKDRLADDRLDEDTIIQLVRAVGQTTARLAEWQTSLMIGHLFDPADPDAVDDDTVAMLEASLADMEPLLVHAWRRQLAAAANRALTTSASGPQVPAVVGFADMVSFTRLSRDLADAELAAVVERFEAVSSDIVAGAGGRLVKTLGDEVLFTAESPVQGAEIALEISTAAGSEPDSPDVRAGVAYGPVLPLMGDVFGTTVNLASRLTSMARRGTVLVDERLAAELITHSGAFELVRIVRRPARGLGVIQPYVLRRR